MYYLTAESDSSLVTAAFEAKADIPAIMDRERRIDNGLRNLIFSLLNIISHKVPYDNYILTFINAVFFLLRTKKAS